MFDWHHLPVAGGIYDQDPEMMASFRLIVNVINRKEVEKERRQKRAQNPPANVIDPMAR
jgi:hypothetical protein